MTLSAPAAAALLAGGSHPELWTVPDHVGVFLTSSGRQTNDTAALLPSVFAVRPAPSASASSGVSPPFFAAPAVAGSGGHWSLLGLY